MSQLETVAALMEAFFQERQSRASLESFVKQAEETGEHQLAKTFRAVIASDGYRERLMRQGFPNHIHESIDYFVCPHCGLVYGEELPDQCLVDETPGAQFEHIK